MSRLLGLASGFVLASSLQLSGATSASAEEKKPMTSQEIQMIVWKTLSTSGSAIDQCNAAYLKEYPTASGQVVLNCLVVKDGSVGKAEAVTSLEGARNLRPCLEGVAKTWKLPPLSRDSEKLSLTIQVKQGAKFQIPKPGEKPPEAKAAGAKEDTGFVQFLPGGWAGEGAK